MYYDLYRLLEFREQDAAGDVWPLDGVTTTMMKSCTMDRFMICPPHQVFFR